MAVPPPFRSCLAEGILYPLYVLRLPPFGALYHVELHLLAFLQAAKPTGLDRRKMHEYILTTLTADEAVPLGIVKPLHRSCFHIVLP